MRTLQVFFARFYPAVEQSLPQSGGVHDLLAHEIVWLKVRMCKRKKHTQPDLGAESQICLRWTWKQSCCKHVLQTANEKQGWDDWENCVNLIFLLLLSISLMDLWMNPWSCFILFCFLFCFYLFSSDYKCSSHCSRFSNLMLTFHSPHKHLL